MVVLHETVAKRKPPYTVTIDPSESAPYSAVALLRSQEGDSIKVTGHTFNNKNDAKRSAAYAMLADERFLALFGQPEPAGDAHHLDMLC